MRVGVLALQGGFQAHLRALAAAGYEGVPIRRAQELAGVNGLVLPGGESSTQLKLLERLGFGEVLRRAVAGGMPVLATCAGLILCAREVREPAQASFGFLDVVVARNAWGRQVDSFEAEDDAHGLPLVFIRAPRITDVGAGVDVVARCGGEPVLVRQGSVVGATFHPELTAVADVQRMAFG